MSFWRSVRWSCSDLLDPVHCRVREAVLSKFPHAEAEEDCRQAAGIEVSHRDDVDATEILKQGKRLS